MAVKKDKTNNIEEKNTETTDKIDSVVKRLNDLFESNSLVSVEKLAEDNKSIQYIETHIPELDYITGGGIPIAHITEISGPEGTGKTTLTIQIAKECLKKYPEGVVVYVNAENSLNIDYIKQLGIDTKRFLILQPICGEEIFFRIEKLLSCDEVKLIIIDSIAALVPYVEIKNRLSDFKKTMKDLKDFNQLKNNEDQEDFENVDVNTGVIGSHSKMVGFGLRTVLLKLPKSKAGFIIVNQLRSNIGLFSKDTPTGGWALKYFPSLRILLKNKGLIEKTKDSKKTYIGSIIEVTITKSRLSAPLTKTQYKLYFGTGINTTEALVDSAINYNILTKKGQYIYLDDKNLGIGSNNVANLLDTDSNLLNLISNKLIEALNQ